jgi:glycosyltransferase involved in cell wall biosynthesis
LVIPCYNEGEVVERTAPPLLAALAEVIARCEVVLVDNGSTDQTGEAIARLCATDLRYRPARVPVNRGYGLGVLTGYQAARGRCVGHIPADGPVAPADVASLARLTLDKGPGTFVTAVRLDRADTWVRRNVSRMYNGLFRVLFGTYTRDINGTPKFIHRVDWDRMAPKSVDYFLEAEMMIKARRMRLDTVPVEVYSLHRPGGRSKVSARLIRVCFEFVRNLVRARFGGL